MSKSNTSVILFTVLFVGSYIYLSTLVFTCKYSFNHELFSPIEEDVSNLKKGVLSVIFGVTFILFGILWFKDPGFIEPNPEIDFLKIVPSFEPNQLCPECEIVKSKRGRHCNVCGKCVERFDHHCPWINNCIGEKNHSYFYAYIIVLQVYMSIVFMTCIGQL